VKHVLWFINKVNCVVDGTICVEVLFAFCFLFHLSYHMIICASNIVDNMCYQSIIKIMYIMNMFTIYLKYMIYYYIIIEPLHSSDVIFILIRKYKNTRSGIFEAWNSVESWMVFVISVVIEDVLRYVTLSWLTQLVSPLRGIMRKIFIKLQYSDWITRVGQKNLPSSVKGIRKKIQLWTEIMYL
jgi:hypothetical protein